MRQLGYWFIILCLLAYAGSYLLSYVGQAASSSPSITVADCFDLARQSALDAGISSVIFVRQIKQESGCNARALSPAGAEGVAQLMPSTARSLGVDPWNVSASLRVASRLMASYLHTYAGSYARSLAAYNAGTAAVSYANRVGGWLHWCGYLPRETVAYVTIILGRCR